MDTNLVEMRERLVNADKAASKEIKDLADVAMAVGGVVITDAVVVAAVGIEAAGGKVDEEFQSVE